MSRLDWINDLSNIAALYEWLEERGETDRDPSWVAYFISKPWKWDESYKAMRAEREAAHA